MPVRNDPSLKPTKSTCATPTATVATTASTAKPAPTDAEDLARPPAAPARHLSLDALNHARASLRLSLVPSVLTNDQAFDVVGVLAGLPVADFRNVIDEMSRAPHLERVYRALRPSEQTTFVDLLARKGVVGFELARPPPPASPRAPTPPSSPPILRDDPHLAQPLRDVIFIRNSTAVRQYNDDYAAYRACYQEAAQNTKSIGELRALGPISAPQTPEHAPGLSYDDPSSIKYERLRGSNSADVRTAVVVADQARALTGRPVAGVSVGVEAKVMVTLAKVGVGAEGSLRRTADGRTEAKGTPAVQVKVDGVTIKATDDVFAVTAEIDRVKAKALSGPKDAGAEVLIDGNGGSVVLGNKGVKLSATAAATTVKAAFNGDSMEFGVAKEMEAKNELGGIKLELGAFVGLQGVSNDDADAFVSTSEVGFFDAPPELARGKSWSALPTDTRADYEGLGWSAQEWAAALDLEKATRRAL